MADHRASAVVCVDFGSTFTKAALVSLPDGELLATSSHRTTVESDLWDGFEACRRALADVRPDVPELPVLACSSAGGGLRIAVVGNEELVTAEAGRRVALSSGGRVVAVVPGPLDDGGYATLEESRPDVVLLTGGTDGGNAEVLVASARRLAGWPGPVVVAGNRMARREVTALLDAGATPYVVADNVVPKIGVLAPDSARAAIREMFIVHVIGGKHLSDRPEFAAAIRGATPDLVLAGVEMLAGLAGDTVVVDVGGATTDVHSVLTPGTEEDADGDVVGHAPAVRTVEGDLGLRWSAVDTLDAAVEAGLLADSDRVRAAAERRAADPGFVASDPADRADDLHLATAAVAVALRRHAGRSSRETGRGTGTGRDLREIRLVVGSGGVLRHAGPDAVAVLTGHLGDEEWRLPERYRAVVDVDYRLAPAGLLGADHAAAAAALLRPLVAEVSDAAG